MRVTIIPWLVAACGPDLAELEVEQQALVREVDVLSRHVDEMRMRMQSMGMLPSGPVAAGSMSGPVEPLDAADLAFTVERTGSLPQLAPLVDPERRAGTACGWRLFAPWLDAVSDLTLERTGSGKASPIVLRQQGRPLAPHGTVPRFERECSGSFRVQPRYIFFSPFAEDAVAGPWTLEVDPALPLPRAGDGRPMYWVFPGTELTFTFDGGWDVEAWGPFGVSFDARLLAVGEPGQPHRQPQAPAEVEVLDFRISALDNRLGFDESPDPPRGPFTLAVRSPEHGPWVLIETLLVGNDDRALLITAEATE